jgi:hypothetical protein
MRATGEREVSTQQMSLFALRTEAHQVYGEIMVWFQPKWNSRDLD